MSISRRLTTTRLFLVSRVDQCGKCVHLWVRSKYPMSIRKVGVVGCGLMGSGIAQTCAQSGYETIVLEVNQQLLEKGLARIHGAWDMLAGKGKLSLGQVDEYRGRLHGTLNMADFAECNLVIEPYTKRLCAKASGAILSQAPEHDADHGDVDPGFFTARKHFVVFGEPAPGGKPGKRALHDPAPFEDMEASWADLLPIDHGILGCPDPSHATPGMLHDLHFPAEYLFDPLDEAALLVGTIRPDQLESREATLERPEQLFAAVMILDVGFMDQHTRDQPHGIHEQMPLAAFHALAAIVAAPPPF